ncbi:MAG: pyrroline-5-carboxylate reductase, partial [Clostridia bacterium]|nr:pyrroline-5-carboxylate reductase [Clostridia bacterium]
GLTVDEHTLTEMICRTVIGSAEMLIKSGKSAEELIRAVTSPNGTTERAMNVLYAEKTDETIDRAMRACTKRAEEMSKQFGAQS